MSGCSSKYSGEKIKVMAYQNQNCHPQSCTIGGVQNQNCYPQSITMVKFSQSVNPSLGCIMQEGKFDFFFSWWVGENEHLIEQFFSIRLSAFHFIFNCLKTVEYQFYSILSSMMGLLVWYKVLNLIPVPIKLKYFLFRQGQVPCIPFNILKDKSTLRQDYLSWKKLKQCQMKG